MFSIIEKIKRNYFFAKFCRNHINNGNIDNKNSKFARKKWYVIDSESKGYYSHENPIKFLTSSLESNVCDYSDAYILVTGNITVTRTIASVTVSDPQTKNHLMQLCK